MRKSLRSFVLALTILAAPLALGLVATQTTACVKAPPTLGPVATQQFYKTRVIKALDVFRDAAIDANAQVPPVLSTATTRQVVLYHKSALLLIQASDLGWKTTLTTGLDELLKHLSTSERTLLTPYIALIKTVLQEVA